MSETPEREMEPVLAPVRQDRWSTVLGPLRAWKANVTALPRPVWILCLGAFVNRYGSFVVPFLAIYMTREGYTTGQTSLALAAYGAGNLVASILGGYLADRIGRRNTIALSMGSAALALLWLAQAEGLAWIVGSSALVGLTAELYRPACSALLADLVPAGQRVSGFAAYRLAINAGWAFGPATAGLVAEHSFLWLFVGDAASCLVFGVVAWTSLPHGLRSARENSQWSVAWRLARQDRRFWQALVAAMAVGLIFFQMSSTFGLHVTRQGFSTATYGLLISLNGLLIVFLELPLTAFTTRWPARRVMKWGYLLLGVGFSMNALTLGLPGLAAAMVVFTFGEMIAMPVMAAYMADLAPNHVRGRYMGLFGLTMSVALLSGPGLGMLLYEHSPSALWLACGFLGVVAAWVISRETGPVRTEAEESPVGIKPAGQSS